MHTDLRSICVTLDTSIRCATSKLDANRLGVVVVVDKERRLLGTVLDSDLRRAVLDNISQNEPISLILNRKAKRVRGQPLSALAGTDHRSLLSTLRRHKIGQIPLTDRDRRVIVASNISYVEIRHFIPPILLLHCSCVNTCACVRIGHH